MPPTPTGMMMPPSSSISPSIGSDPSATSAINSDSGSGGKRKRSALDDVNASASSFFSSVSREKKKVSTGAVTMNRLNETLDGLGAHLASVSKQQRQLPAISDDSPQRRVMAMVQLQTDEPNMDIPRLTALVDLFKCSTEAADTYLALFREDVRKGWIQKQLTETLGFPPLSPIDDLLQ
jgi:hypothetical protein